MNPSVVTSGRRLLAVALLMVALGPLSPDGSPGTGEPPEGHGRISVPRHREEQSPAGGRVQPRRQMSPANPFILPSTATTIPGFEPSGATTALGERGEGPIE